MNQQTATLAFAIAVWGLFALDRDRNVRHSRALWIPVVWLWIYMSRPVSMWLAEFGLIPATDVTASTAESYLDGSPIDRNAILLLLVAGIIVLLRRKPRVAALLRANRPILLLACYGLLSVLWSDFPEVAFKRWFKGQAGIVMVMIVFTETDPLGAVKRVLARTSFILAPASLLLVKYYPDLGRFYDRWTYTPIYVGVTTNKNELGVCCLVCGLASVWRFLNAFQDRTDRHRVRRLVAHGAVIAIVVKLLGTANSMTSTSCFVLATGLMILATSRVLARRPWLLYAVSAGMVVATVSTLLLGIGGGALEEMGRNSTLTGRTEIWALALSLSGNPLLGCGYESFWLGERLEIIWKVYWFHPIQAHNGYIETYLDLGWIGIALLAIVIITGFRQSIAFARKNPALGRVRIAFSVVPIIYNITEAAFGGLMWFVFLLGSVIVPADSRSRQVSGSQPLQKMTYFPPGADMYPKPEQTVHLYRREELLGGETQ